MKYSQLNEFSAKDWDGTPFMAVVTNHPERDITTMDLIILANQLNDTGTLIAGFSDGSWREQRCAAQALEWDHVYRVKDNVVKATEVPMTNIQLIQWLVSGEGLYGRTDGTTGSKDRMVLRRDFPCEKKDLKKPVDSSIMLYSFTRETLVKPTVDLLLNDGYRTRRLIENWIDKKTED